MTWINWGCKWADNRQHLIQYSVLYCNQCSMHPCDSLPALCNIAMVCCRKKCTILFLYYSSIVYPSCTYTTIFLLEGEQQSPYLVAEADNPCRAGTAVNRVKSGSKVRCCCKLISLIFSQFIQSLWKKKKPLILLPNFSRHKPKNVAHFN